MLSQQDQAVVAPKQCAVDDEAGDTEGAGGESVDDGPHVAPNGFGTFERSRECRALEARGRGNAGDRPRGSGDGGLLGPVLRSSSETSTSRLAP